MDSSFYLSKSTLYLFGNNTFFGYRGGNAGAISITALGGLSIGGDLLANGGSSVSGSNFMGTSMNVQLKTNATSLTVGGNNDGQIGKISGANLTLFGSDSINLSRSSVFILLKANHCIGLVA